MRADEPGTSRDDDAAAGHGGEVCLTARNGGGVRVCEKSPT
jgi:hypothetical protein